MADDPREHPAVCRFAFDEAAFRDYYELHFRPHDKASGWKFMWLFFIVLLIYFAVLTLGIWGLARDFKSFVAKEGYLEYLFFLVFAALLLIWCASYGFRMWRGLRRPRWGSPRWEARIDASFRMLSDGPSEKPVEGRATSLLSPFALMPCAWIGCEWHDRPLFYDLVPGLLPPVHKIDFRLCEGPAGRCEAFEARFYPDRLEKGSPEHARAFPYADVFDIVEDERFPDLAIVRINDEVSEVVVRPSAFEGETWDEVKARIAKANGWVTLREALFGERKPKGKDGL